LHHGRRQHQHAEQQSAEGMITALGAKNDLTEEDLRESWREFWAAAEQKGANP